METLAIRHGAARNAIGAADNDRCPGCLCFINCVHGLDAIANGAAALRLQPDHEAGIVDQMDDRQAEELGEFDEALDLLARQCLPRSTQIGRIGRQHRDRPAVQPGKGCDRRAAPAFAHFENAVLVEHSVHHGAHRVNLLVVPWNDGEQFFVAPFHRVGIHGPLGEPIDRGWQI